MFAVDFPTDVAVRGTLIQRTFSDTSTMTKTSMITASLLPAGIPRAGSYENVVEVEDVSTHPFFFASTSFRARSSVHDQNPTKVASKSDGALGNTVWIPDPDKGAEADEDEESDDDIPSNPEMAGFSEAFRKGFNYDSTREKRQSDDSTQEKIPNSTYSSEEFQVVDKSRSNTKRQSDELVMGIVSGNLPGEEGLLAVQSSDRLNKSISFITEVLQNDQKKPQKVSKVGFKDKTDPGSELPVSSISQEDCFPCAVYSSVADFSQVFVDSIIDEASVKVHTLKPQIQSVSFYGLPLLSATSPNSSQSVMSMDSSTSSSMSDPSEIFVVNWPSIENFNIGIGESCIEEYLSTWYLIEPWKYYVVFTGLEYDRHSSFYNYEAIFSIPTQQYPVPQVTASMYFTIEVSKLKPRWCLVDVTYYFEGCRRIHYPGGYKLQESWLFDIVNAKIGFYKTLCF